MFFDLYVTSKVGSTPISRISLFECFFVFCLLRCFRSIRNNLRPLYNLSIPFSVSFVINFLIKFMGSPPNSHLRLSFPDPFSWSFVSFYGTPVVLVHRPGPSCYTVFPSLVPFMLLCWITPFDIVCRSVLEHSDVLPLNRNIIFFIRR